MGTICSKKKNLPISDDSLDEDSEEDSEKAKEKPKQQDKVKAKTKEATSGKSATKTKGQTKQQQKNKTKDSAGKCAAKSGATPSAKVSPKSTKSKVSEASSSSSGKSSKGTSSSNASSALGSCNRKTDKSATSEASKSSSTSKSPPLRIPTKTVKTTAELKRTSAAFVSKVPQPSFSPECKDAMLSVPASTVKEHPQETGPQTMKSHIDSQDSLLACLSSSVPSSGVMNEPGPPPSKPTEPESAYMTPSPSQYEGASEVEKQQAMTQAYPQLSAYPMINYQERPRVLQLDNGVLLNLPNAQDYNRQLTDEQLQAQIRNYFEELMTQMKVTQQMVQAHGSEGGTPQPPQQNTPNGQSTEYSQLGAGQHVQFGNSSSASEQQTQWSLQQPNGRSAYHPMPVEKMAQPVPRQAAPSCQPAYGNCSHYPTSQPNQMRPPSYPSGQQHQTQQYPPPAVVPKNQTPPGLQQQQQQWVPSGTNVNYQQIWAPQAQRTAAPQVVAQPKVAHTSSSVMFQQPSRSVQYIPSHNSMGNPSLAFLRPQATDSQLFPSIQPQGTTPFRGATPAQAAHQRPQVMKQYQPPPTLASQQPAFIPTVAFPTFPPTVQRNRAPPPPAPMPIAFGPQQNAAIAPPCPIAAPGANTQRPAISSGPPTGMVPMSFPMPTPIPVPAARSLKHHHDNTHEHIEAIHREIEELKTLVQGQEWNELVSKMEKMLNDFKKLKCAYATTVRELKKDDRFRAEKNRADSEIRAVYAKLKNEYRELTSGIDVMSKGTRQMVNSIKRNKTSPKAQPAVVVKQQDLQKLSGQMDRLMNDLTQLKGTFAKITREHQSPNGSKKNS